MLSKSQLASLLGRSLTSGENTNYITYLDIAVQRLKTLGITLDNSEGSRVFDIREGYRTLYLDPFTSIDSVTIDGETFTTFVKKQNDSYQGEWFNALEFDDPLYGKRATVAAAWGYGDTLPNDLAQLLAGMFALREVEANTVQSKKIEDFTVTYRDTPQYSSLVDVHSSTIAKYAVGDGAILHGCV